MPLSQVEELGRQDGGREEAQAQEAGDRDEWYVLEGQKVEPGQEAYLSRGIPFLSRPSALLTVGSTWCWALGKRSRTRLNSCRNVARTVAGQVRTERHMALSSATKWARSVCALCSNTSASVCGRCSPEHLQGINQQMVNTWQLGVPSDIGYREKGHVNPDKRNTFT